MENDTGVDANEEVENLEDAYEEWCGENRLPPLIPSWLDYLLRQAWVDAWLSGMKRGVELTRKCRRTKTRKHKTKT